MIRITIACLTAGFLAACSGGGGGSDMAGTGSGGTGGSGVSSGPINGFGSIFVAGTEWETDSADSITIDGEEVSETELKLGMRTTVRGTKSSDGRTGTATSIEVDNSVEGPISDAPPPVASPGGVEPVESVEFVVLGQTFVADGGTAFSDGASLDQLATGDGDWVEVSGLPGVDGKIRATRVELKTTPGVGQPQSVEVEGLVSDLDSGSGNFSLGSASAPATLMVVVDGSSPGCPGPASTPDGAISDGMAVEVYGELLADGRVCASKVEIEDDFEDEDDFEIEGVVTEMTDPDHFVVSGISVVTNASTDYEPTDLEVVVGMEVEVEGNLVDGVLTATKVEQEESLEIEAEVTALVPPGVGPDFVVLGLTIQVDESGGTQVEGSYGVGSAVEVEAVDNGVGGLTALEVEVESGPVDRARIEGRVDSVGVNSMGIGTFVIHGITVSVGALTECEEDDDMPIACVDFFTDLAVGDKVKATDRSFPYDFSDGDAKEVSFED